MEVIPHLLIIVTLLLAACGGASDTSMPLPTAAPESAVTIRFARSHGMGGRGSRALLVFRRLANSFQDEHPHIKVQIAELELAFGSTIADAAKQADCFVWSSREPEPAALEAVLSLQPVLDADPSFPIDDFYPSLLAQFAWQGELRGLPSEAMPYVLKINKDLFDDAGVPYPGVDWTTDDLTRMAIALTRGQGDDKQFARG
jgi:ABC-type glycerol-3-phosphate transport system substrate-binding protein